MESYDRPSVPREAGRTALRASDADREQVATLLRESFTAGRLTMEELEDRLARAYRSRLLGELDALVHDLPVGAGRAAPTHRRSRRLNVPGFILLLVIVAVVWAAIAATHFFPVFPLLFFWLFFGRGWRRRSPAYAPSRSGSFHGRYPGR